MNGVSTVGLSTIGDSTTGDRMMGTRAKGNRINGLKNVTDGAAIAAELTARLESVNRFL